MWTALCENKPTYARKQKYIGLQSPKYQEKLRNARLYNNDKNPIHLPRHSSFMIMHTFADWGNTGQNMAESIENTTVSTTKAHRGFARIVKEIGRNP